MSEDISWIDRAKQLVSYHKEALDFIERAGEQLPAHPGHAGILSRLWVESDGLDDTICSLLHELNSHLLEEQATMDTTRGASMRPTIMDEQSLFYECSWNLLWDDEARGISVNLAIDASTNLFEAHVRSIGASETFGTRFPLSESNLKEALTDAYVSEVTSGSDQ